MSLKNPVEVIENNISVLDKINNIAYQRKPDSSFFLCDVDDIIKKYENWKYLLPRVEPHYAVKCNDHPVVLKLMAALGLGFDCASKLEIAKILSLGVQPDRIIFANSVKPLHHIRYAAKVNVDFMTFDNELELYKIKDAFPQARVLLRIRYDAKASVSLGLKFGCDPETEAQKLLKLAQQLDIKVIGVSFHVGWGCKDPLAYSGAIAASRRVFDVASSMGFNFEVLDIGGGYPGELNTSIKEHATAINSALDQFFPDTSIRVISEPGTYFMDSAFTLACNIISVRPVTENCVDKYMYYLNDGVFGSLSMIISVNQMKYPQPLKKRLGSKVYPSIVWGPTCDSTDLIIKDILLPQMQFGEWVVFVNMGAYSLPLCTAFNSIESPRVYTMISQEKWLLLRDKYPFAEEDFVPESKADIEAEIN